MQDGDSKQNDAIKDSFSGFKENVKSSFQSLIKVHETLAEIDLQTTNIVKNFGGVRTRVEEMTLGISDAASGILLLTDKVKTYEEAMALAATKINEIAVTTKRNFIATSDNIKDIIAVEESSGVASAKLIQNFKEQAYSLGSIKNNMQKVVDTTRSLGINTKAVSESVVANLGKLNTFNFKNGIEGLTRMSAQAALFNIDMSKIFNVADRLFDPEQAVEMAASLQRLGVATGDLLDPLKLMDLGRNDPEELTKQIVEMSKKFTYFNEQNQKFEILPGAKGELREIAKLFDMNGEELAKMALGSMDFADKMSKIRFPKLDTEITEDQKTMIANMAEMKDGKYQIAVQGLDDKGELTGKFEFKDISKLNEDDFKSLERQSKENTKSLDDTARSQLTVLRKTSNTVESILSSVRGGIATSKQVRKSFEEGISAVKKYPEKLQKEGGFTVPEMRPRAEKLYEGLKKDGPDGLKKALQEILGNNVDLKELFNIEDLDKKIEDLFQNPPQNLNVNPENIKRQSEEESLNLNVTPENIKPKETGSAVLQREGTGLQILRNVIDYSNLKNQNVETVAPMSKTESYNYNYDKLVKEQKELATTSKEVILHKHEDINFIVKVDAPPGVDSAYLTDVMSKALKNPDVIASLITKQSELKNNYGLTGGKVGDYTTTA